jgi:PucR C-terminal helix-turn-helix domain/GGDEF-like domain
VSQVTNRSVAGQAPGENRVPPACRGYSDAMTSALSERHFTAAAQIIRAMEADGSDLAERVVKRIRRDVRLYATEGLIPAEDVYLSVKSNISFVLAGLTGARGGGLGGPEATGRARAAQGASLVEMLTAYRVGFAEVWSALVSAARSLPDIPADIVVDLAGEMFTLQNEYSDAAVSAYRDESQQMARASERERGVLVEAILTGAAARGQLWEVAQMLRLPLDGVFIIVAAEATVLGHDPVPRVESALAVLEVGSAWRLQSDLSLGVLSLPNKSRAAAALAAVGRHATRTVGASPVFTELRQAPWGLQLARLALAKHPGGVGVEQFPDSPLSALAAAAPQVAIATARTVLGGVLELPPEDRDLLLATFTAWVDAGGSANAAGAALYCHPNTVRYRLRRIEASAGRSLTTPGDVAELVAAVLAWSQLPHN